MEIVPVLISVIVLLGGLIAVVLLRPRKDEGVSERLQQLADSQFTLQQAISEQLEKRLDAVSHKVGQSLNDNIQTTQQSLSHLKERLAVIDAAQKNITDLSSQMVSLQDILSNKQKRGVFGEIQLQDLITSILPPSAYEFQVSLTNNRRVDCLLKLPNPPGAIAIDAKFPLESYERLIVAETPDDKEKAGRQFSQDILLHVKAIAEKYIVTGETADSALMFLPSESIYAELHANFPAVVEKSFRQKVWIVSPTTLMATLNTVRAVLKDARMHEQAGLIQQEVAKIADDVLRLDDRVEKLQTHFRQAEDDVTKIRTSTDKIVNRSRKVQDVQLADDAPENINVTSLAGQRKSAI